MNLFEKLQEKYIRDFSDNIPIDEFLLNILIIALLVALLRIFYIRFGNALSNRRKFSANFLPLALATLLVIMIVKSSIALSLGLVGTLSIVRFRAAIKDPEELTYLFIAIGLGLAGGANQPVLAVVAFAVIILLLYIGKKLDGRLPFRQEERMFVNIKTEEEDLNKVTSILTGIFPFVEMKRMDTLEAGLDLVFICKAESLEQISELKDALKILKGETKLSIIDQPDLIL